MCQAMLENGAFDPALCPLLKDLSPAEIAERLEVEPIKSCRANIDAVASGKAEADEHRCPALAHSLDAA